MPASANPNLVIAEIAPFTDVIPGTLSYRVPEALMDQVQPGVVVVVPLRKRLTAGMVASVRALTEPPDFALRDVHSVVDATPALQPAQLRLAEWMCGEYHAVPGRCYGLMVPPGLTPKSAKVYALAPGRESGGAEERGSGGARGQGSAGARERGSGGGEGDLAQRIVGVLQRRGALVESRLRSALRGARGWRKALDRLVDAGVVQESATMEATVGRPVRTSVAQLAISSDTLDIVLENLADEAARQPRRAEAMRRRSGALQYLADRSGFAWADWITAETGATRADLVWLAEQNYLLLGDAERWRDPLADIDYVVKTPPPLTDDQQQAWAAVRVAMIATDARRLEQKNSGSRRGEASPSSLAQHRFGGDASPLLGGLPPLRNAPEDASGASDQLPITSHFLVRGVTGSGKTEIYMRAVELALQQGRGAIVLVPEISLTPQTARRFLERFPAKVALIHSQLKPGERYDTWRRIRAGELPVVVGARSALFAPVPDVGVIVIDEEHDQSYKQGSPPYYHTRNVAMAYARLAGATLVMGSATPSLEVWHAASRPALASQLGDDRVTLLELPNRVRGHVNRIGDQQARLGVHSAAQRETETVVYQPLPDVQVIDMRAELRGGNVSMFSGALQVALAETLQRGEQAILFLNRRGAASCVICRDCGYAMRCPNDDVPLTYHQARMKEEGRRMKEEGGRKNPSSSFTLHPSSFLKCHQCDHIEPVPAVCPACGRPRIRFIGIGTQKVESAILEQFPKARVVRWDRDTSSSSRTSADQMLQRFVNQQADVLVGTQMIAKGLDLPLVTLVGVVLADVGLFLPDFRASERVFDLIEQVAGRAGRGLLSGRVLVQTYNPQHPAIAYAARHDVAGFAQLELGQRALLKLPPVTRLARFEVSDEDSAKARLQCEMLARQLRKRVDEPTDVIGPAQAYFTRRSRKYRWQLLVRTPSPRKLLDGLDVPRGVIVDIDPISVL